MGFSYKNSKGQTYYLHGKGKLFYFSKTSKPAEALNAVPAGYKVVEMKTGMPVLKKV